MSEPEHSGRSKGGDVSDGRGEIPSTTAFEATPMSYISGGRQYVVIAAGGHGRSGTTLGDTLVAFSLPD